MYTLWTAVKPTKKTREKKSHIQKIKNTIDFSFLRLAAKFYYCFFVSLFSLSPSPYVSPISPSLYIYLPHLHKQ